MKNRFSLVVFYLISFVVLISCSSEEETTPPPSNIQTQQPEPEPQPEPTTPDPVQYTLTVTAGQGGGVSTEGGDFQEGTILNVVAEPNYGFSFSGWSDGNFDRERQINISEDLSITASFERNIFTPNNPTISAINQTVGAYIKESLFPGYRLNFSYNNPYLYLIDDIPYLINENEKWFPTDNNSVFLDFDDNGYLDYFGIMRGENCTTKIRVIKNIFTDQNEAFLYDSPYMESAIVRLIDSNGDGQNEIIVGGANSHSCNIYSFGVPGIVQTLYGQHLPVKIYTMNDDGTFTVNDITPPQSTHDFATGDIDNDGDQDLIYLSQFTFVANPNQYDGRPFIYLNDGNGTFTEVDSYEYFDGLKEIEDYHRACDAYNCADPHVTSLSTDLFDLNNDNILDLVISNNHDLSWFWDFNEDNIPDDFLYPTKILWGLGDGKFDFDNSTELLASSLSGYNSLVNPGSVDTSNGDNPGYSIVNQSFFDYNQDGYYDVFLNGTPAYKGDFIVVFKNNGDGTFEEVTNSVIDENFNFTNELGRISAETKKGESQKYENFFIDYDGDGDFDMFPVGSFGLNGHWNSELNLQVDYSKFIFYQDHISASYNPYYPEWYYRNDGGYFRKTNLWECDNPNCIE
ncbi:MAG: VCBS repeat-containing protein [Flavobacteriaceae bacterium]